MAEDQLKFEDWKREQTKYELERKHQFASNVISHASRELNVESIMEAFVAVQDYIVSIPLEELDTNGKGRIDEFLKRVDDISDALHGHPDDERVKALRKRFRIVGQEVKVSSIRTAYQLSNLQYLLRELRSIHISAGYFATSSGLRLTLHKKRSIGMDAMMKEEGFVEEAAEEGQDVKAEGNG